MSRDIPPFFLRCYLLQFKSYFLDITDSTCTELIVNESMQHRSYLTDLFATGRTLQCLIGKSVNDTFDIKLSLLKIQLLALLLNEKGIVA